MFCTRCGVQLEERDHFCSNCGAVTGRGPYPAVPKRLMRPLTGNKIAGVCNAFAEYLDGDPVIVRLLWVILTLGLPPAGILGYIIAWVVIPKRPMAVLSPASVPQG